MKPPLLLPLGDWVLQLLLMPKFLYSLFTAINSPRRPVGRRAGRRAGRLQGGPASGGQVRTGPWPGTGRPESCGRAVTVCFPGR